MTNPFPPKTTSPIVFFNHHHVHHVVLSTKEIISTDDWLGSPHMWHSHPVLHLLCSDNCVLTIFHSSITCVQCLPVVLLSCWMGFHCLFWPPLLPSGLCSVKRSKRAIPRITHAQMSQQWLLMPAVRTIPINEKFNSMLLQFKQ